MTLSGRFPQSGTRYAGAIKRNSVFNILVFKITVISYPAFNEGYLRLYLRNARWLSQFFITDITSTN